ncbi:MAG: glutamate racemase [Thermoflexales bacterium]|nr:glutamate racemase [Thermoflexales bacterium]
MIGLFDSGLGGLSVWRALKAAHPEASTLYLGDQGHAPYGPQPLERVRALTLVALEALRDAGATALVIACNTATAAAADAARARWPNTPIVGIEPALKPAAAHTRTGVIAALATQASFDSPRFALLAERYASGVRLLTRACPEWVALVEAGDVDGSAATRAVDAAVGPLLAAGADHLVLGCTHFPFLSDQIEAVVATQFAQRPITILDPAPAVIRQLHRVAGGSLTGCRAATDRFMTTGDPVRFARTAARLLDRPPGTLRVDGIALDIP